MTAEHYDVIIIGTGAGGGTQALTMAHQGAVSPARKQRMDLCPWFEEDEQVVVHYLLVGRGRPDHGRRHVPGLAQRRGVAIEFTERHYSAPPSTDSRWRRFYTQFSTQKCKEA